MDPDDWEGIAGALFVELGIDPEDAPTTFALARAKLGPGAIVRLANFVSGPAAAFTEGGRVRIAIKASVPLEYAHFYCGHELGHLLLRDYPGLGRAEEELAANYIGAALMMPPRVVHAVYRAEGFSPKVLAETVTCTQTAAALRMGEVLRRPLAAVSPAAVRVRGPEAWVWPDEGTIRRWAGARGRPGLAKVRLTDQPKRVALLGDEDASETG